MYGCKLIELCTSREGRYPMQSPVTPYVVDTSKSPIAKFRPISLSDITLNSQGFWHSWQNNALKASLDHGYEENLHNHVIENFEVTAGRKPGGFKGKWFADSELYKWMEAVAYYLVNHDDVELKGQLDYVISLIQQSQMDDGYLNTFFQLTPGVERWSDMIYGHEQYCAGHLFQAAVAHYRCTGESSLLNVALKFADHIASVFGPGKKLEPCGHPEIKMGLVELYRISGEKKYLELAQFLLDQRGKGLLGGEDHHQDHVGIRDAKRVAGHAVRQLYLLSGATDIYLETGEKRLNDVLKLLWKDMTQKRIHLTGGVGSTPKLRIAKSGDEPYFRGEAFGEDYDLPNFNVHNETCAQVASVMWNWRMLLSEGDSSYADLLEWTLYNGALSGMGLDGKTFFYTNPLASKGDLTRKSWFPVACCPPNIMRTVASVQNYIATTDESGLQIHLFDNATIAINDEKSLSDGASIEMETKYPWDGKIKLAMKKVNGKEFTISLRIPKWVSSYTMEINGKAVNQQVDSSHYQSFRKSWEISDVIELVFKMEPKFVVANPYIESDGGRMAITRGPIVYCFEGIDQGSSIKVSDIKISQASELHEEWDQDMLGGIIKIAVDGNAYDNASWESALYKYFDDVPVAAEKREFIAIPYYAWANRQASSMCVWCDVEH